MATEQSDTDIYRPPLWSQLGKYPARDDRRVIGATLWPGVLGVGDLRVTPRAAGANMSVDVAPGVIAVRGTEQAEQGAYLCWLTERVNIPIDPAPSAGNWRLTPIYARVFEPVDADAYWRVLPRNTPTVPEWDQSLPGWLAGHPEPSARMIALVEVRSSTSQITQVTDNRTLSVPAPIGASFAREVRLPGGWLPSVPNQWQQWGTMSLSQTLPWGIPVDIELTLEGVMVNVVPYFTTTGLFRVRLEIGGRSTHISDWSQITTGPEQTHATWSGGARPFSRKMTVSGVTLDRGSTLTAFGEVQWHRPTENFGNVEMHSGCLTLRVSPSASGFLVGW